MGITEPEAPAPAPEAPLYDRLKSFVAEAKRELSELDREREHLIDRHRRAVAELDERRQYWVKFLRTMGEEPARTPRQRAQPPSVSPAVLLELIKAIESLDGYPNGARFTALQLHELAGDQWTKPHTYEGMRLLRDAEFIGKVRERDPGTGRDLYRVLDPEVGNRIKARALEAPPLRRRPGKRVKGISPNRARTVYGAFQQIATETGAPVSTRQVIEHLKPGSQGGVREAIAILREQGLLISVGARHEGGASRTSITYNPGDPERLEELYA